MPPDVTATPLIDDWLRAIEHATGKAPRHSGDGQYEALCPAHEDRSESLSVSQGRKQAVVATCHTGCTFEAIRGALGFEAPPAKPARTNKPQPRAKTLARVEYIYHDADGSPVLKTVRRDTTNGKTFHQEHPDTNGSWVKGGLKGKNPLYGLPDILEAPKRKVVIVEGEKCVHAAREAFPNECITTWPQGSKSWAKADWSVLRNRPVSIVSDGDDGGRAAATGIAKRLHHQGCTVRLGLVPGDDSDDIADWIEAGGKAEAVKRLAILKPYEPPAEVSIEIPAIDDKWIDTNPYYRLLGIEDDNVVIRMASGVILRRQRERLTAPGTLIALATSSVLVFENRGGKAGGRRRADVGRCAHSRGDKRGTFEIDAIPHFCGLPDGTILDLRTGDARKASLDADRYVVGQLGAVPESGEPELWQRTLAELFYGDELVAFMRRWMGYCLTGFAHEHRFLVMHGPGGTGKSMLLSVMQRMCGSYFAGINQRGLFGTHGDHLEYLMRLKGKRLATVDDAPPFGWRVPEINGLVSGESLTARGMAQGSEDFVAQAKLVFTANSLPEVSPPNPGLERRIMPVELARGFETDTARRRDILDELPRIVAWAIEGAKEWYREGLSLPGAIKSAAVDFSRVADQVGAWLDDCCEFGIDYRVSMRELQRSYHEWSDGRRLTTRQFRTYVAQLHADTILPMAHHGQSRGFKGLRLKLPSQQGIL